MSRRLLALAALALAFVLAAPGAHAAAPLPFDPAAFQQAQADGKTIVVDFHADWCPTCKKQAPVIVELLKEERFAGMVVFVADYDTQIELKRQLKVSRQSTLVVFKGEKEVGRSTGVTRKAGIASLFEKGL